MLSVLPSDEIVVREAEAQILPDGPKTRIRGYNGTFPGPLIETWARHELRLRITNALNGPIVNHLHGGRTPAASDGYPTDLVQPGETREYIYPNRQRAATLWYHDHRMDYTGPQVWRGLVGMYIIRDEEESKIPLPRGDREIPLIICDRSFDYDASFLYPPNRHEYMGGVLGDVVLVNGAPWPRLEVANVRYRFRILNASNARRYELSLPHPVIQIGSDGGLLAEPVSLRSIRIAPGERFDVIVDFSRYPVGSIVNFGSAMQFRVSRRGSDDTSIPAKLSTIGPPNEDEAAVSRVFDFAYQRSIGAWTINGKAFDVDRVDARPKLGSTEIWRLQTDFSHPLHLHLVHFQVLGHSGRPNQFDSGYKDTIDLLPGQAARILIKFEGYRGRYLFHCHNLEHEDMAMMGNFEVV
jgi:spore coat protein A